MDLNFIKNDIKVDISSMFKSSNLFFETWTETYGNKELDERHPLVLNFGDYYGFTFVPIWDLYTVYVNDDKDNEITEIKISGNYSVEILIALIKSYFAETELSNMMLNEEFKYIMKDRLHRMKMFMENECNNLG